MGNNAGSKIKRNSKIGMFGMLIFGCAVGILSALISVAYRFALGWAENARVGIFERTDSIFQIIPLFQMA